MASFARRWSGGWRQSGGRRRRHTYRRSVGSCLPCRALSNPSETRARFLPGLKNSCDKLSVLLGSTLHRKWGGGAGISSPPPPTRSPPPRSVACNTLAQTVCTHGCRSDSRQWEVLATYYTIQRRWWEGPEGAQSERLKVVISKMIHLLTSEALGHWRPAANTVTTRGPYHQFPKRLSRTGSQVHSRVHN